MEPEGQIFLNAGGLDLETGRGLGSKLQGAGYRQKIVIEGLCYLIKKKSNTLHMKSCSKQSINTYFWSTYHLVSIRLVLCIYLHTAIPLATKHLSHELP